MGKSAFEDVVEAGNWKKCPYCGNYFRGKRGFKAHLRQSDCGEFVEDL